MTATDDPSIEIRIGDDATPLWMRRSSLDRGEGPIMPGPDHDQHGWFEDSYAHLSRDGMIRRYLSVIGTRADIVEIAQGAAMTAAEVSAVLTECGMKFEQIFMPPAERLVRVQIGDGEGFTYDNLAKIAERLGTTDMRFTYDQEHELSEVTYEPSRAWLDIELPPDGPA